MGKGKFWRGFQAILAGIALGVPAIASGRPGPAAPVAPQAVAAQASWLATGSDIPADPDWHTGTLANGVRYAVRRNAHPAGTIAIRIRMDVGALMEKDDQQGWAHLMEHMAFRGTKDVPDGEGIKIWQRLGASFGTDSNAFTSLRSTLYKLDLPRNDAASFNEAMHVLAGMMRDAAIDPQLLATERQVVLAERASSVSPLNRKLRDASRAEFLTGLLAERRDILGTPETLGNARADTLRAFYKQWYRPERAVVVVVGDADPALLERVVRDQFEDWKPAGPAPAEPDYGSIKPPAAPAVVVADPRATSRLRIAWALPHDETPQTVARLQRDFARAVAIRVLSHRLGRESDHEGAIVGAGAGLDQSRRLLDETQVVLVPRRGDWRAALLQGFGTINGLLAAPPRPDEIAQQTAALHAMLAKSVTDRDTELSSGLADQFIDDVDQGNVGAVPQFYLDLFDHFAPTLTPDRVQATLRELMAPDPRLMVTTDGSATETQAVAALAIARKVAGGTESEVRPVSIDELPQPGAPGRIVSDVRIDDLGIERVRFANGVELDLKQTGFDKARIGLLAMVGAGQRKLDPRRPNLYWSSSVLGTAGVGPFTREELGKLVAGRQIGFSIRSGFDAVDIISITDRADLADSLRLSLGAATGMRLTPLVMQQMKDNFAATYASLFSQPASVYRAFAGEALYGGDLRFRGTPSPREVERLRFSELTRFWRKDLAGGPIKLVAVGDFDRDALVAAVARSYGALPRVGKPIRPARQRVLPPITGGSLLLHHEGDADQALIMRAFPIPGAYENLPVSRALGLAMEIVRSMLNDRFRESEGGTYSPMVSLNQPDTLPRYGVLVAGAQVRPERIADFGKALDQILGELATTGPSQDQLERARATALAQITRSRASNSYWINILRRDLDDPRVLDAVRSQAAAYQAIDAAAVRAAVAHYLRPGSLGSYEVRVLPAAR